MGRAREGEVRDEREGLKPLLDSSVLLRYITGDPGDLARLAADIIDREEEIHVTETVLAECAHVLRSYYRMPREAIVDALLDFLARVNIGVRGLDKGEVMRALLLCRPSGRVSVPDALVWAAARSERNGIVYSFDERFPADGIILRRRR